MIRKITVFTLALTLMSFGMLAAGDHDKADKKAMVGKAEYADTLDVGLTMNTEDPAQMLQDLNNHFVVLADQYDDLHQHFAKTMTIENEAERLERLEEHRDMMRVMMRQFKDHKMMAQKAEQIMDTLEVSSVQTTSSSK
ncbi:hypothetical protein GF420_05260 [candidate division GN15 bacterium]|nr:hypothetical protein [candidate division GN15 bacterium]